MGVLRDQERPNHRPGFLPCSSSCTHSRPLEKELFLALRKLRSLGVPSCQLTGVTCSWAPAPEPAGPAHSPGVCVRRRCSQRQRQRQAQAAPREAAGADGCGGRLSAPRAGAVPARGAGTGPGDGASPEGRRFREFRAAPGKAWWRMMRSEGSYLSRGPYESWT